MKTKTPKRPKPDPIIGLVFVAGARAANANQPITAAQTYAEPYRSSWLKGYRAYMAIIRK